MTRHCRLHSLLQLPALGTSRNGQGTHNGDVFSVTRIAGIMAAKCTPDLVLLCHPGIGITGRTGMQMEAMTATMGAALTVYDMLKAVDMGMMIEGARLIEKQGVRAIVGYVRRKKILKLVIN